METTPAPVVGLTKAEVQDRVNAGLTNQVPDAPARTIAQIVRANVFTPVNAIILVMFALIMVAAPGADALFAGVVISNSVIGIVQELRARRELERLAILNAPKARVLRDGETLEIDVTQVVQDDVLVIRPGDQIVVDGRVVSSEGLEINEALLTGESDPVLKSIDDKVMSGSFAVAGSGCYEATHIGADSYAATLAEDARRFELAHSELRTGVNRILRWLSLIIPPASILLLISLLRAEDTWREALRGTVAGAVAMVPDGLVLLTSIAFIVGILALARKQALAKELASVELLARVDVLCLDKTGTITSGEITFADIITIGNGETAATVSRETAEAALGALTRAESIPNSTQAAIATAMAAPQGWQLERAIPFSSDRKWSAASFGEHGLWFLGAPEFLLQCVPSEDQALIERANDGIKEHTALGRRVVLLALCHDELVESYEAGPPPHQLQPVALVLLEDELRPHVEETLGYIAGQGIELKVISGDHPETVAAIARRAGIEVKNAPYDARELPHNQAELAEVLDNHTVFGRVNPHQKRDMVHALQSRNHMVAMTGDGVNDVLALKDADMGIAMGAGSTASRAVAQLVLLDNAFSTLPDVLAEGRRVINNIERVANLFVTKAAYAVVLAALTGIFSAPFLFLPRHLTIVSSLSIGIPGFFLALEPNTRRATTGFVDRVVRFSVPSGLTVGLAAFAAFEGLRRYNDTPIAEARSAAVFVLLIASLVVLGKLCRPLTTYRLALLSAMAAGYVITMAWPMARDFFALEVPNRTQTLVILAAGAIAAAVLELGPRFISWWQVPLPVENGDTDDQTPNPVVATSETRQ